MKVEFFKDMLEFPAGLAADGQNDEHPIDLNRSNIMNIDFRHLLMFLYDQCVHFWVLQRNIDKGMQR
jgi:hypothetical protein